MWTQTHRGGLRVSRREPPCFPLLKSSSFVSSSFLVREEISVDWGTKEQKQNHKYNMNVPEEEALYHSKVKRAQ